MQYFMGIDVGTSGAKAVIFDGAGRVVCSAYEPYALSQPQPLWAEQNPDDWWRAVTLCIAAALQRGGMRVGDVAGVGLSGQMHGLVLLDADNKVIRPAILWCDRRTEKQCAEVERLVTKERLLAVTANPSLECFTAQKLLWVRENEPQAYRRTARVLLPKDYINFKLTGRFTTDVSDASGMQLMDVAARRFSDEVLHALQIPPSFLAELLESCALSGTVTAAAAKATGLKQGTPVAAGAGDQAAAGVGNGIVRDKIACCNVGTSGVVFAHTDAPVIDARGRIHTFCHAVPDAWHVMGVTQAAGLSMQWFKNNFYGELMSDSAYDVINAQTEKVPAGCGGLTFLPYLMGERTPHLDARAKGVFYGVDATHTRAHFARAVMEGVSFSLDDCLQVIASVGIVPAQIRLAGGGAKSALWRQMLADVFNTECVRTNSAEAGCLGAAILAAVCAGAFKTVTDACNAMVEVKEETIRPQNHSLYGAAYAQYRRLYPALKPLWSGNS